MSRHWSELDEASVPTPRRNIAEVEADGEVVLYDPVAGLAHVLNGTAATVWAALDGVVDVGTLGAEIAEAFVVEQTAVTEQLVTLVRDLGRVGLLADVVAEAPPPRTGCP